MSKVYALGFFDCLHIGHRMLIEETKKLARAIGAEAVVFTFDDNFLQYLTNNEVKEIFTLDERLGILGSLGISEVSVIASNSERFNQSGEAFFNEITSNNGVAAIVCGKDYTFGKGGACGIKELSAFCAARGVTLKVVELKEAQQKKVSSTRIRELIERGDIAGANELLGAKYFCSGQVVHGRGDGHKFGIPTANLRTSVYKLLPRFGVYATATYVDGRRYLSLTNVGVQPTFGSDKPTIETLILDFNDDLYGKTIKVEFAKRIRDIQKFDSVALLTAQIAKDIEEVRKND